MQITATSKWVMAPAMAITKPLSLQIKIKKQTALMKRSLATAIKWWITKTDTERVCLLLKCMKRAKLRTKTKKYTYIYIVFKNKRKKRVTNFYLRSLNSRWRLHRSAGTAEKTKCKDIKCKELVFMNIKLNYNMLNGL